LAWAIQISFLDLLPQFPSEKDLLERRYNRYDKRGVTGESLGAERLIRIRCGNRRCTPRADAGIVDPPSASTAASRISSSALASTVESIAGRR